jgi:hypothetical protein
MPVASLCDHTYPSLSWGTTTTSKQSQANHPSTTPKQTRLPHPLIHFWTTMEPLLLSAHFQLSKCTTIGDGTQSPEVFLDVASSGLLKLTTTLMLETCRLTYFHRSHGAWRKASSFSTGQSSLFPWVKLQGRESDYSPRSSAEIKKGGAIPPLSHISHTSI